MKSCTCNPTRTFTWVDEDCPKHGREAEEWCDCGHEQERHDPEMPGCIECRCLEFCRTTAA